MIEQSPGNFYALVRSDGVLLARYPWSGPMCGGSRRAACCAARSAWDLRADCFRSMRRRSITSTGGSAFQTPDFPVYAIAGTETAAIRSAWLSMVVAHLIFGLPATLLLFFTLWVALRRTRRLHDEAERREVAETRCARPNGLSYRPADRRCRARLQQSPDDRQRHGAALAPFRHRRKRNTSARHHYQCDATRRKPHTPNHSHSRAGRCCSRVSSTSPSGCPKSRTC